MPLLENLVQGLATAAGADDTAQAIQGQKDRRQGLSDEFRKSQITEHMSTANHMHKALALLLNPDTMQPLPGKEQQVAQLRQQLGQVDTRIKQLYDPNFNPQTGMVDESQLHKLGDKLHITQPPDNKTAGQQMQDLRAIQERYSQEPKEPSLLTPDEQRHGALIGAGIEPRASSVGEKPNWKPYKVDGVVRYFDLNKPDSIPPNASAVVAGAAEKPKKGYKFDLLTDEVVNQDTAQRYARGAANAPEEVSTMFKGAKTAQDTKQAMAEKLANLRGASFGMNRPISVLDSANGNAPTEVTMGDFKKEPGRYVTAGPGAKALAQENLMQDIAGTSKLTRDAINNLKEDFPIEMKAKIALAMKADDPHGAIDQLISSGSLGALTDDQQDFLIATRQLAENAMAMRTILGAGQGSEDMRDAIRSTLPGLLSPDKSFATRQLDAFDKTIARLHRGVPKVKLNDADGGGAKKHRIKVGAKTYEYKGTGDTADLGSYTEVK